MGSTTSSASSARPPTSSQDIIKALTPQGQSSPTQRQDAGAALNRLRAAEKLDKGIDDGLIAYKCTGKDNGIQLNLGGLNGQQKAEFQDALNTLASGPPLRDKERCPQ